MSRSPTEAAPEASAPDYIAAWRATHRLIREGGSWSGNERDVALGNDSRGGYVDISATSGLDFNRDGRSTAWTDYDGDGGMDLFTKSRNGARLRMFRNTARRGHWLQVDLEGKSGNRDGIGARVQVEADGATLRAQTLRAGNGYMAQSSKRLHFGLGEQDQVADVIVHWPGGAVESFGPARADARYRLMEGRGEALLVEGAALPPVTSKRASREPTKRPAAAKIPLAPRLPLPFLPARTPGGVPLDASEVQSGRAKLIVLWAGWCPPCLTEMNELAAEAERLKAAGIEVLALHADPNEDRRALDATLRAMQWPHDVAYATSSALDALDLLQKHILERRERIVLPSAFLVDAKGRAVVYVRGPVSVDELMQDALAVLSEPSPEEQREFAAPFRGLWSAAASRSGAAAFEERLQREMPGEIADSYNVRALRDMAEIDNSKARTFLEFGLARMAQRKLEEAEGQFRAALELDPTLFEAWSNLAPILHRAGRHEEAIEAYEEALRLEPSAAATRFNLGIAHLDASSPGDAERIARELEGTHPELAQRLRDLIQSR